MDNKIDIKPLIIFDFQGTLVKSMRPPKLNGTVVALKKLSEIYTLAIFTGASNTETVNILKKLNIYSLFMNKNIITKGMFPSKPNPQAVNWLLTINKSDKAIFVGDTVKDYLTAKNSSIKFIFMGKEKLGLAQINTVDELLNVKINL